MKKLLLSLVLALSLQAQTALTAYSYTVSQALYAQTTGKPSMLPFQVILFQVPQGTAATAGITVVPQGTNVVVSPSFTALSNLNLTNGWYEIELRPSPVDPTQPMVLTAPLVSIMPPPVSATQVN